MYSTRGRRLVQESKPDEPVAASAPPLSWADLLPPDLVNFTARTAGDAAQPAPESNDGSGDLVPGGETQHPLVDLPSDSQSEHTEPGDIIRAAVSRINARNGMADIAQYSQLQLRLGAIAACGTAIAACGTNECKNYLTRKSCRWARSLALQAINPCLFFQAGVLDALVQVSAALSDDVTEVISGDKLSTGAKIVHKLRELQENSIRAHQACEVCAQPQFVPYDMRTR